MEWVLYVIGGFIGLCLVYAVFYALCRKFPWIRLVLAVILAIASYFVWYTWWISLIVLVLTWGLFLSLTSSSTRRGNKIRCPDCNNDILDILEETDDYLRYYCPKCKSKGTINLYR